MKNLIFLAPPAAGKGTLSDYLETKHHYVHVSTGELFRTRIKVQDEEAKKLEKIIASGNLVDDETTLNILKEKLMTLKENEHFIIDGLPRNLHQAKVLDIILRDLNFSDYVVVFIQMSKENLEKRMTGRRICPKCKKTYNIYFEKFKPQQENICDICKTSLIQRDDDNIESFNVRYQIFEENNIPIVEYYKEQNRLVELNNEKENQELTLKELERIVGASID